MGIRQKIVAGTLALFVMFSLAVPVSASSLPADQDSGASATDATCPDSRESQSQPSATPDIAPDPSDGTGAASPSSGEGDAVASTAPDPSDSQPTTEAPEATSPGETSQPPAFAPRASYDFIAPVLKSFTVLTPEVTSPGTYKVEVEVEEEDTGIDWVSVSYVAVLPNGKSRTATLYWSSTYWDENGHYIDRPLYTGKHTLEMPVSITVGALRYELNQVNISDDNQNSSYYRWNKDKGALVAGYDTAPITPIPCSSGLLVTSSEASTDYTAPVLKGFTVLTPEVTSPGTYKVELDVEEEDTGIDCVSVSYVAVLPNGKSRTATLYWSSTYWDENGHYIDRPLYTGKHTLEMPVSITVGALRYELNQVNISDDNENSSYYRWNKDKGALVAGYDTAPITPIPCSSGLLVTSSEAPTDYTAPVLKGFTVLTPEVTSPGTYKVELDVEEEETGIDWVSVSYVAVLPSGKSRTATLYWSSTYWDENGHYIDRPLYTGKHTLEMPVSITVGALRYELNQVNISDDNENSSYYRWNKDKGALVAGYDTAPITPIPCDPYLVVQGEQNISVHVTANDPKLQQKLQDMPEDSVAVVDLNSQSNIAASIFETLAGQNKTVVFQDRDVQWEFNGKDIDPARCKDIRLDVSTSVTVAADVGLEGEETVLELRFPDNGQLPGVAKVRIYSQYLLTKYHKSGGKLYITYYKDGKPASEPAPVVIEGDQYAVFQLTHNSTFIISATVPKTAANTPNGGTSPAPPAPAPAPSKTATAPTGKTATAPTGKTATAPTGKTAGQPGSAVASGGVSDGASLSSSAAPAAVAGAESGQQMPPGAVSAESAVETVPEQGGTSPLIAVTVVVIGGILVLAVVLIRRIRKGGSGQ